MVVDVQGISRWWFWNISDFYSPGEMIQFDGRIVSNRWLAGSSPFQQGIHLQSRPILQPAMLVYKRVIHEDLQNLQNKMHKRVTAIGSMYGIFTYIYDKQANVGTYTIRGSYGRKKSHSFWLILFIQTRLWGWLWVGHGVKKPKNAMKKNLVV